MAINNAFQANDWNIRRFLVLVLSLLLAFWGSIFLDTLDFSIPLIRQITGFLILTFVPGILILRILRIHHLGAVKTNVYAAGISLATLMFAGFFVNIVYPLFGIFRPFSLWPLVATISVLVGILCFISWFRDWDFAAPISINLHEILSPPVLALSLLPFGAIAGTHLMNFYGHKYPSDDPPPNHRSRTSGDRIHSIYSREVLLLCRIFCCDHTSLSHSADIYACMGVGHSVRILFN